MVVGRALQGVGREKVRVGNGPRCHLGDRGTGSLARRLWAARSELLLPLGVRLVGSNLRATPSPQKAAGALTPESVSSGAPETVLASRQHPIGPHLPGMSAPHEQILPPGTGPPPGERPRQRRRLCAWRPGGCMLGTRGGEQGKSRHSPQPPKKGKPKAKLCPGTFTPPKMSPQTKATALFLKVHPAEKSRIHRSSADFSEM